MTVDIETVALPKLYIYDNCPYCLRVRAILGLKGVDHELVFLAYHDVATPMSLVGAKQTPIFQLPSGKAFAESGDIIKYVDESYGDSVLLKEASGREDLVEWTRNSALAFWSLIIPRTPKAPFAEFAKKKSRKYFLESKEHYIGTCEEAMAKTPEHLAVANEQLEVLAGLLFSDRQFNESGVSYDDLELFGILRILTLIKGIVWPPKVRAYLEYYAEAADIPLLDVMAL